MGGVTVNGSGGGIANASRKAVGVGSKPTDPAVGAGIEEDEGGVKVEVEGVGEQKEGAGDGGEEGGEEKGKYSRRKIVDNSWRYEEPEEDPYLKGWFPCMNYDCTETYHVFCHPDNSELTPYRINSTGRGRPRARTRLCPYDHWQSPAKG